MASTSRPLMGRGQQQARRIIIVPFKDQPKVDDNFFDVSWAKLENAVHAILQQRPTEHSSQTLYGACEDVCRLHKEAVVYERLCALIRAHVQELCARLASSLTADLVTFLTVFEREWSTFLEQLQSIRQIFLYLDRTYVIHTQGLTPIFDVGLSVFRDVVLGHGEIDSQLVAGLLHLIQRERDGDTVDRGLLKSLVRMLLDLHIYRRFEAPFVDASQMFYLSLGQQAIADLDGPAYLLMCERRLREETDRLQAYLSPTTRGPLIAAVEDNLLRAHANTLLEKCFESLMDDSRIEDLGRLFTLLDRVNCVDRLREHLKTYVRKRGAELATDTSRDATLVEDLLKFKERLDTICDGAFGKREAFAHTLQESFEYFMNIRQNKPAELVAKFLDAKLRAGNKESSERELENIIDRALVLFRYIQSKDVFEAFYKKDLAKRLLLAKSASADLEKVLLSKLKAECGAQFTNKLEGMFRDIELSRELMASFKEQARYGGAVRDFELDVAVLTASYWPTYPPTRVALPADMAAAQDVFTNFYQSKHSGRRLTFQNTLGTCVLKATFPKGKKELSVSLFQALVLLLFNDADRLTYSEIRTALAMGTHTDQGFVHDEKELRRTLFSLAAGKVRVLQFRPLTPPSKEAAKDGPPEIADGDVFAYNADFSNPLVRIRINQVLLKETVEEQQDTHERVFLDRQYQVDAAIVRIMKTRKRLKHELLLNELYSILRFPARPSDLKKRIESLIDRDYLERDKDDASTYIYLA